MENTAKRKQENQGRPHRMLTVCGYTNVGIQREDNQDTFVITDLESGQMSRPCVSTDVWVARPGVLMLVCDGMGGRAAGAVAAQVAANAIQSELRSEGENVGHAPVHSLKRAVLEANEAVHDQARVHPEERGMGTTCTAALVSPDHLAIAHVGDSRAYLLRNGALWTLTRDQTLAASLVEAGVLKPDEVDHFPYRHVLSQALGPYPQVEPAVSEIELKEGDRVLLCSDGLHGPVEEETIATILGSTTDPSEAAAALVKKALEAGGPDNVTVVVADCGPLQGV